MKHISKLYLSLIILLPTLFGCNNRQNDEYNLHLPDHLDYADTSAEGFMRLENTGLGLVPPKGFTYLGNLRFEKKGEAIMTLFQYPLKNYNVIDSANKLSNKFMYFKNFILGKDRALVMNSIVDENEEQLALCIEHDSTGFMLVSSFRKGDINMRASVLKAIKTVYIYHKVDIDTSLLNLFSIDLSRTKFRKYDIPCTGEIDYTISGKISHKVSDETNLSIYVCTTKFNNIFTFFDQNIEANKKRWGNPTYTKNTFILNDHIAIEAEFHGVEDGKKMIKYMMITEGDKSTIIYLCSAFEDQDNMMKQFKAIARTLKLK